MDAYPISAREGAVILVSSTETKRASARGAAPRDDVPPSAIIPANDMAAFALISAFEVKALAPRGTCQ